MTTATGLSSPASRVVAGLAAVGAGLLQPRVGGHRVKSGPLEMRERAGAGDAERLRVPGEQRVELPLPQPVVERDERHPRPRGREQRDGEGRAVDIQVDEGVGGALADQRGTGMRPPGELGGGDPAGPAPGKDAVAEPVGGHVEQQRQAHGQILAQSEAGSGLAAWISSGLPSSARVPLPALVHSTWMVSASST